MTLFRLPLSLLCHPSPTTERVLHRVPPYMTDTASLKKDIGITISSLTSAVHEKQQQYQNDVYKRGGTN
jgi:hypothetical protein